MEQKIMRGGNREGKTLDWDRMKAAIEMMRRDSLRMEFEWRLDRKLAKKELDVLIAMHDMGD